MAGKRYRRRAQNAAQKAKAGAQRRDALERKRREERVRIEARRRQLEPLPADGVPLHSRRIGPMVRRIRIEQGFSINGLADLTGVSPKGVKAFEESETGGHNETLALFCRAFLITQSEFYRRIEKEEKAARGGQG